MDVTLLRWGDQGWGDEMVLGAGTTVAVAACAYLLGLVIATTFAAMKLSGHRGLRLVASAYTTIVRGLPELLIIYLVFFGGGQLLRALAKGVFGYGEFIDLPVFATGVICIGLTAGAYATEVLRGAIQAVPPGQSEAAAALGLSSRQRFWLVVVPQAARYALPGLGNVWQLTLKETSLLSVIGLVEIMRHAAIGAGSTQEPFTFYLTALLLYLALTSVSNRLFEHAEAHVNVGMERS